MHLSYSRSLCDEYFIHSITNPDKKISAIAKGKKQLLKFGSEQTNNSGFKQKSYVSRKWGGAKFIDTNKAKNFCPDLEKSSVTDLGCLSRILIFTHSGSQISDPGSKNSNKREG